MQANHLNGYLIMPNQILTIPNGSPATTVCEDAELEEVFELVFCEALPPTLITCPGNTILLLRLLFCLMLSTEVLYCCAIVHKDSPD
jgi:hypothetical protein